MNILLLFIFLPFVFSVFPKDNQSHGAGTVVLDDRLSAAAVPAQQHPVGGQPAPFPGAAEGGVGEEEERAGGQ